MTAEDLTLRDYLRASDEYDISDIENIPEPVRERLNQQLGNIPE
jgi:hypothetical protein